MTILKTCFLITAACAALNPASVAQESLQFIDGRFVMNKKMTKDDKGVMVHFDNGDVYIPSSMIRATTARNASGDDSSLTPEAKEKLAKGLVLYKGRWIKAKIRDAQLKRERKKREAKIAEALTHRKWAKRHKKSTAHFDFEFTVDPEDMKEYMVLMEVYYKEFQKEWRFKHPKKRVSVCFYHDEDYFHQVSGAPAGVAGWFMPLESHLQLNFYYDRLDRESTIDTMFHETNHYLTYLIDPKFRHPRWINESLAEYYGASEWDPKRKKMTLGRLQEGRLAYVQDTVGLNRVAGKKTGSNDEEAWLSLRELITTKRFGAGHYAWGWTFVHYLLENKKYAKKFKKYYVGLAKNKKIKKVLAPGGYNTRTVEPEEQINWLVSYLGVKSLEALEKEWHAYIRTLKPATHRGYHMAGMFALMRGMPIKAQRLYNISLDMGSKNAMTYYGLGRAQYRKSKYRESIATFDKALAIDPLNGMFYIWKAKCLNRGGKSDDDPEVKRLKKLALEIEPDNYSIMLEVALDEALRGDK